MNRMTWMGGDSSPRTGGEIPGSDGLPAFALNGSEPSLLPVLLAVPHAGRTYPPSLLQALRHPAQQVMRLEDRHVDQVARYAAQETGATLLVADAPRAMIDLNRSPDDIDHDMIRYGGGSVPKDAPQGWRTRSGLGLIPRRLPGAGELWKARVDESELAGRIDGIHTPYHSMLGEELVRIRERWGAALLLDIHSMPPLPQRLSGAPVPVCVLGDRFGASCSHTLAVMTQEFLASEGLTVAVNRPYAGGYVLDRHSAPRNGIHALQIEFCRSLYLDFKLMEPSKGVDKMGRILAGLVRLLADEVSSMGHGRPYDLAAE
jgi:N-formylglutamate amidohydrolase